MCKSLELLKAIEDIKEMGIDINVVLENPRCVEYAKVAIENYKRTGKFESCISMMRNAYIDVHGYVPPPRTDCEHFCMFSSHLDEKNKLSCTNSADTIQHKENIIFIEKSIPVLEIIISALKED